MPIFVDMNGAQIVCDLYPGESFRATVINHALRRNNFLIVIVNGTRTPMYQCCQCRKYHTSAGIEGDHMVARVQGGHDHIANLQMLCTICNRADVHHRGVGPVADRTREQYAQSRKNYP